MKFRQLFLVAVALHAAVIVPAWSQQPQDALSAVRSHTDLTDEDRNQIRAFIAERIAELVGSDAALARDAGQTLRAGYTGTDAFKQAYAAAYIAACRSAYSKADVAAAARLLAILNTLGVVEAQPVFVEALQDERVGIRAAGALGLKTLRAKLAQAGGDTFVSTLNALRDAAKKETARDALRAMYAALNYGELPAGPDLKPVTAALLDILEHRARLYAEPSPVPAFGADDVGLVAAEKLARAMSDDERRRLTAVAATMVRRAIEDYVAADDKVRIAEVRDTDRADLVEMRNGLERLVLFGERLLTTLLTPRKPPAVLEAMRKIDRAGMKVQWREWVELLKVAVNQDFTLAESPEGRRPGP